MTKTQLKIQEWEMANVERLTIKPNLRLHLSERIAAAVAAGKAPSRQAYIVEAVLARLRADGVPEAEPDNHNNI